ncbi:hypothetical protein NEIPOLOT_01756 [Neisseria polysaccharea ATCC 43768]|nr:hypothetical protein NEIPOLOT_01756 [Neisseria polysaccharea ATCC 43768]
MFFYNRNPDEACVSCCTRFYPSTPLQLPKLKNKHESDTAI